MILFFRPSQLVSLLLYAHAMALTRSLLLTSSFQLILPLDLPALDEETMFSETSLLSALLSFVLLPVDGKF